MSQEIMALVAGLMNYAAWSTGLPIPNELPVVQFASQCEIENHMAGRAIDTPCPDAYVVTGASYTFEDRVIRLANDLYDFRTIQGQAFLLHEIVHYVQHDAVLSFNPLMQDVLSESRCLEAAFEPAAYRAQFEWIRLNKLDPWTTIPLNPIVLHMATTCRQQVQYGN